MSALEPAYVEKLAHMAGQIADFFKAYPDEQAVESIAAHINQFWAAHMRVDFLAACKDGRISPPPLILKAVAHIVRSPNT